MLKLPSASRAAVLTYGAIGALLVLVIVLIINGGFVHISFGGQKSSPATGAEQPAEFLYLDSDRVAAYLAQIEGGRAPSQHLTDKLTTEANAKVGVGEAISVGGTAQEERFIERTVTPTASSTFFQLFNRLQQTDSSDQALLDLKASDFSSISALEERGMHEGSFVVIHGAELVSPRYISPYVVVRQAGTLAALFPIDRSTALSQQTAKRERRQARSFAQQVGPNPRLVFVFRTPFSGESTSNFVRYLLPMQYLQLTDERSLLEGGGGTFTILGKVIRTFGGAQDTDQLGYTDSATRQTWGEPLKQAPSDLLQRGSLNCIHEDEPGRTRGCLSDKLTEQTTIPPGQPGAVIIPLAIYK